MAFAFAHTTEPYEQVGGLKRMTGTYTNGGGDTGGEIITGLSRIIFFSAQVTGAAVSATSNAANETFPLDKGEVTLVTVADEDGIWEAWGY